MVAKQIHRPAQIKKSLVKCLLLTDLNIFNLILSKIGKESIVILREDLEPVILSIGRECTLSVKVQFKKKKDKDSLENA